MTLKILNLMRQGRRCTCSGESKKMSQAPETAFTDREESAGKPTNGESKLPIGKVRNEALLAQEKILRLLSLD
jgi:hypothetical protein